MRTHANIVQVRTLIHPDEAKPTVILIASAFLTTVHHYFGSIDFAVRVFPFMSSLEHALFMFGAAFLLLGVVPAVLLVCVFHESPGSHGVALGEWKFGLGLTAILFPVIACVLLYPASHSAEMKAFYPLDKGACVSMSTFIQLEISRGFLFYTAWEFFFRGFMLFGLRKYVGDWLAICIQTIPSCLWHIGTPTGEIFGSIAGGILFGIMALRTRSVLWPLLLHFLTGVGLDSFIVLGL